MWFALSLTWGFSFLFIKVAGEFLTPFQQTFGRLSLGAVSLATIVLVTKRKFVTHFAAVKHLAFLGTIGQAIPFTLFAWAEHYVSSIAAGLVNSMMALWTALLAILFLPEEKVNRSRATGLVIGFLGIMILLGFWDANFRGSWLAYLACALAAVCYAITSLWMKRFVSPMKLDPISATTTQLFFGTLPILVLALTTSSAPTDWPLNGVLSLLMLGVFGTGIALALNFELVNRAGAVATSTVTYSMPIVATAAGALILKEQLHWYEPIGAVIALLGIAMVQGLLKPNFLKTN